MFSIILFESKKPTIDGALVPDFEKLTQFFWFGFGWPNAVSNQNQHLKQTSFIINVLLGPLLDSHLFCEIRSSDYWGNFTEL